MPDRPHHHDDRVDTRAELLPEERAAGSDVPDKQAAAILEESDARTDDPAKTRHDFKQTPDKGSPGNPIGQL